MPGQQQKTQNSKGSGVVLVIDDSLSSNRLVPPSAKLPTSIQSQPVSAKVGTAQETQRNNGLN